MKIHKEKIKLYFHDYYTNYMALHLFIQRGENLVTYKLNKHYNCINFVLIPEEIGKKTPQVGLFVRKTILANHSNVKIRPSSVEIIIPRLLRARPPS